jgi:DNA-binding IclR family transcriptional regulator
MDGLLSDPAVLELVEKKRASRSVLNACHALVVLMDAGEAISLGEFARRSELSPATAHRVLRSLAIYEFVRQNADGNYELGLRLLEFGSAVAERFDVVHVARPYLERLADDTGETVHLAVLENDCAVYIDKVEGRHSIRLVSRPGYSAPLHATSLGKALCAGLDGPAFAGLLVRLQESLGASELERFRREIDEVRRSGHAFDREELLPGLTCVGAAIHDRDGRTVSAVSVAGPSFRMESLLEAHLLALKRAAAGISLELGYAVTATETEPVGSEGAVNP